MNEIEKTGELASRWDQKPLRRKPCGPSAQRGKIMFRYSLDRLFRLVAGSPAAGFVIALLLSGPGSAWADSSGDYSVGVATGFVIDSSRPWDPLVAEWGTTGNTGFTAAQLDAASNLAKAVRTLVAEVWYPVNKGAAEGASAAVWGEFRFAKVAPHNAAFDVFAGVYGPGLGVFTYDLKRESHVGLPIADADEQFPLIIMLHGNGSTRDDASRTAEALAKHGYVVVAIGRPGNSVVNQSALIPGGVHPDLPIDADGRYPRTWNLVFGDPLVRIGTSFKIAVEDVEAVLQAVNSETLIPNGLNSLLAGKIDSSRVGLHGCSLGSSQVQFAQSVISDVLAWSSTCTNLVPDHNPLIGTFLPEAIRGSSPQFPCPPSDATCIAAAETTFGRGFDNDPYVLKKPALWLGSREDTTVFGLEQFLFASIGLIPFPDPNGERFPAERQLFNNATSPVIYAQLDRMDHLAFLARPELQELRKLGIVSGIATGIDGNDYEIHAAKTINKIRDYYLLNFYDAVLKGKANKLQKLIRGRFEADGLRVEHVNLDQ